LNSCLTEAVAVPLRVSGQRWFLAEPARHGGVSTTGDGTSTGCPVPAAPSDGATAAAAGRDAVPVPSPPCLQQGDSGTRRGTPAGSFFFLFPVITIASGFLVSDNACCIALRF